MGIVINVIRSILFFSCLILFGCNESIQERPVKSDDLNEINYSHKNANEKSTDRIVIENNVLILTEIGGKCGLTINKREFQVVPTPPCHFLRTVNGKPQIRAYPERGIKALMIVVGDPIDAENRLKWGLNEDQICGTVGQGIVLKEGEFYTTDKIIENAVICKDNGLDEKNYWYLSQQP